jgi:hypothetical protein
VGNKKTRGGSARLTYLCLIPVLSVASCLHASHLPVADAGYTRAVKEGRIDPRKSRIVVFLGQVITPGFGWSPSIDLGNSQAEIFINGYDAGGIHAGEALAIDLPPGQYGVGSGAGPETQKSPTLSVALAATQVAYVSNDTMMRHPTGGGLVILPGFVGIFHTSEGYQGPMLHLHTDGLTLIQGKQIVASPEIFR